MECEQKRAEAERRFSKAIVDAFYDEIQAEREDSDALREELITLPNADDGYSRVLFADVLDRIASTPQSRLDELLPWKWVPEQKLDQPA